MTIAMFAIIGAMLNMGTGYWVCFGIYCVLSILDFIVKVTK